MSHESTNQSINWLISCRMPCSTSIVRSNAHSIDRFYVSKAKGLTQIMSLYHESHICATSIFLRSNAFVIRNWMTARCLFESAFSTNAFVSVSLRSWFFAYK